MLQRIGVKNLESGGFKIMVMPTAAKI